MSILPSDRIPKAMFEISAQGYRLFDGLRSLWQKHQTGKGAKAGFRYSFIVGLLSIYIPMQVCLYVFHTTFVEALLYALTFVIATFAVVIWLTLRTLFFTGDL